jgi:hypothetical protein
MDIKTLLAAINHSTNDRDEQAELRFAVYQLQGRTQGWRFRFGIHIVGTGEAFNGGVGVGAVVLKGVLHG